MKLKDIPQWDCAMQSLLWRASFAYTLKAHQYKSTRFVAGVPDNWPPSDPPASWPSDAELDAGGGGILADVMGLGKTVSGLGGAVLRDVIVARGGSHARAQVTRSRRSREAARPMRQAWADRGRGVRAGTMDWLLMSKPYPPYPF